MYLYANLYLHGYKDAHKPTYVEYTLHTYFIWNIILPSLTTPPSIGSRLP